MFKDTTDYSDTEKVWAVYGAKVDDEGEIISRHLIADSLTVAEAMELARKPGLRSVRRMGTEV